MIATSKFTPEKLIRATRLSLAMLISVAYITYVGISEGIAVTMTCAIILYDNPTVGGAINKSYLRFLGTLLGFLIAMVFIIGFANSMVSNVIGIIIGVFMAAYWFIDNKYSYVGIMTCATLPMLLLNDGDIRTAFLRLLSISLGVLIAYLLNCFFYPDYARNRILITFKTLITELNTLLDTLAEKGFTQEEFAKLYLAKEVLIIKEFAKFVRWHGEAQRETLPLYTTAAFSVYANFRHIYHLLSIMAFNLEISEMQSDDISQNQLRAILAKSMVIINSLDMNYSNYFMPAEFNLHQTKDSAQKHTVLEYKDQDLSSTIIIANIVDEIDLIIKQLVIIYNIRKEQNYYC